MRKTPPGFIDKLIAENLTELRKIAGLSLNDVATALQVSLSLVGGWEKCATRIPIEYLLQVADILGCTILDILQPKRYKIPAGKVYNQLQQLDKIRSHYERYHTKPCLSSGKSLKNNNRTRKS